MKKLHKLSVFLLALFLGFSSFAPLKVSAETKNDNPEIVSRLGTRGFAKPEYMGPGDPGSVTVTSAVHNVYDGVLYGYSMTNGGYFNVVDIINNKLVFYEHLPDSTSAYGHTVAPDGTVYISANTNNGGTSFSYDPAAKKITKLGNPSSDHQFWSSATDDKGNLYVGSFKEQEGSVFKYDVETKKFENLGIVNPGSGYVRSMAYHDGYIYLGVGEQAMLFRLNIETKQYEDLTGDLVGLVDKQGEEREKLHFIYDLDVVQDTLVARVDAGNSDALLFFDLKTQEWSDTVYKKQPNEDFGAWGWNQLAQKGSKAYVTYNNLLHELDVNDLSLRKIGGKIAGHRGGAVYTKDNKDYFVTFQRLGGSAVYDLSNGEISNLPNVMRGMPLKLHNLAKDNYGDLFLTSYPGGPKGVKFNTKEETYQSFSYGQAEGIVAGEGDDVYFGTYGQAVIHRLNTKTLKDEVLFNLFDDYGQDRPYIMQYQDDLLLIGTIPFYGKLGGALAIFNPKTNEKSVYTNIVENQSIVGLAKKGNLIYGSTTIRGGLDADPSKMAKEPVIFIWDMDQEKVVKEIKLPFAETKKSPMISGLTFDDKGQLWGVSDGVIFTMDPDTHEFTKHKNIYPSIQGRGMWRPVHIEFGKDGLLYTDMGGFLTILDPNSKRWDHTTVPADNEVDFITLSEDKDGNQNIYMLLQGGEGVTKVKVLDVEEQVSTLTAKIKQDVVNGDFEMPLDQSSEIGIPGWSNMMVITDNVKAEITDEKAFTGNQSLKITDKSQTETIFMMSDKINVEAGSTYTTTGKLFNVDGSASLMVRYYKNGTEEESKRQVGNDRDGVNIIHYRSNHNQWQDIVATVEAPKDADYLRIYLGASKYFQTNGAYYDNIELFKHESFESVITRDLEHYLENTDIDYSLYTEESVVAYKETLKASLDLVERAHQQEIDFVNGVSQEDFDKRITQKDIDASLKALQDAKESLVKIIEGKDPEVPVIPVDPDPEVPVIPVDPDPEVPVVPVDPDPVIPVVPVDPVPKDPTTDKPDEKHDSKLPATGMSSHQLSIGLSLIMGGYIFSRKRRK